MMSSTSRKTCRGISLAVIVVMSGWLSATRAEEIWLHDNSRVYGLVKGVNDAGQITVQQPTGEEKQVPLEDVIAIRFLGRSPLLVQSGMQDFRLVDGSSLRGQILYDDGDLVTVKTALSGTIQLNLAHVKGFVALPMIGFSGRKAEELVKSLSPPDASALDLVLDRRGSLYPGVVRRLELTQLLLDHEELLQVVPVRIPYLAGVRLADAARAPQPKWQGDLRVRLHGRDGSEIQGTLKKIRLGSWHVQPAWDSESTLILGVDEISLVQVIGGRVQYLSQLEPVDVKESTVLAPPQPFRMDRSSQGDAISIAGKRYPWGIGVHADSLLTFELGKRFQQFRADIGIASRIGDRGSVVFEVLGDGKSLYRSPVITGRESAPVEIQVSVAEVKQLALQVTNAGDLDLGDVANWGSARVIR
ncbi:MAG: hypothetical protein ACI9HK_003217 [Pirellulaceae bacterium]|jgi:hypothetical protein